MAKATRTSWLPWIVGGGVALWLLSNYAASLVNEALAVDPDVSTTLALVERRKRVLFPLGPRQRASVNRAALRLPEGEEGAVAEEAAVAIVEDTALTPRQKQQQARELTAMLAATKLSDLPPAKPGMRHQRAGRKAAQYDRKGLPPEVKPPEPKTIIRSTNDSAFNSGGG